MCSTTSALVEDTVFSFAGQYATFLNIIYEDEIIDKYKAVIASKFTPKAIYYFLSHSLSESELAMSVGCMEMINSKVSGVIYTTDPVNPDEECLLINTIYGLGKYLVDGTVTPDIFKVSKRDGTIKEKIIASKNVKLAMNESGGTRREEVPAPLQNLPCIDEKTVKLLSEISLKIERHYGSPQDIEWAIDDKDRLYILQTRPLQVIKQTGESKLDLSNLKVLRKGGVTVCPGAGSGVVYHASRSEELALMPPNAVLVTHVPFPGIIMFINRLSAIVTEHGGTASHMATIAREYRVPTLSGVKGATDIPAGIEVTVDATGAAIYEGRHEYLIKARRLPDEATDQMAIFELTKKVLSKVSPLNLVDSTAENFKPQNCQTIHDITRFVHQKAMEEMFKSCSTVGCKEDIGLRLKTDIPMSINIIYVDRDMGELQKSKWIEEEQMDSVPMMAFWKGVKKEGWPSTPHVNLDGIISVMSTQILRTQQNDFLERSFAILSKEYMLIGLHMGYHFSTVEAMCTDDISKNYVRIQYKDGGATIDRRIRRIKVLAEILSAMGFSNFTEGDFLDSSIHYQSCDSIIKILENVGRLSILSKQLDMALANDSIANWYKKDILKKLNLIHEV
ncbi:MAG: PEP/pyruvate-binding domain-containing protein [bacterium]